MPQALGGLYGFHVTEWIRFLDRVVGLFSPVFSQDVQFFGQRANRLNALSVANVVVVADIDVEQVLPFSADNRERLYFGEVDFVETEDAEHL